MTDERIGLAGTVALLAATVAVLFGVALSRDDDASTRLDEASAGTGAEPGAKLDADQLLELSLERAPVVARRVAKIRGVEFDRVPEPQVTDTEALRELAEDQIAKPKVTERIASSDAELKLLGLLEPDESLADVATDVTADAAAYYDPKEKELFLLGDAVPAGPALAEFVLAHELNHALEDQAFGLPKSSAASDDRVLAESALVEGSATALMTEYAAKHLAVTDLLKDSGALESGATDLPQIALAQVTFAYIGGQRFVEELRENANGGWDLVDFAYEARLPATTEQIIHPEKYLEDERPLRVPAIPNAGPGWNEADSGTVGEFFTREILRQDAEDVGADAAAAGWGGDEYRFFRRDGAPEECGIHCTDHALAIVWRGDDASEAAELRTALDDFVERSLDPAPGEDGAWPLESGWAVVGGAGDLATLALAPDEALARRLASAGEPVK